MPSLSNYLRTYRKRSALTQEEVAFLLGLNGMHMGEKVCRDEGFAREPSLRAALTYEVIYGVPTRELFAGVYEQIGRQVAVRANLLAHRKKGNAKREATITSLIRRLAVQ